MDSQELAILCAKIAENQKATDIIVLEVTELIALTDYFVICSGSTERQVQSIAREIEVTLKRRKRKYSGIEGNTDGRWVLMDYGDVIVHVYHEEMRSYYELEDLWADSPRVDWEASTMSVESEVG